jgi:hypothetical protein
MKPIKLLSAFSAGVLLMAALAAPAQSSNSAARLPSNRYLLVVETSREMQRRTDGLGKSIQELIGSGFGGQARPRDTVGVWTFNDALHSGKFPLQLWTTNSPTVLSNRIITFLQSQRFEKDPEQTALLKDLNSLVKDSDFLTIVFFTSGLEKWNGTPFDRPFNDFIELHRAQQEKARMPFFFALRAQAGSFVEYQVAAPPEPLTMPLVPKELRTLAAAGPAPNLIVSGKKPVPPEALSQPKLLAATNALVFSGKKVKPGTNIAAAAASNSETSAVAFVVDPPRPAGNPSSPTSTIALVANLAGGMSGDDSSNAFIAAPPATVATQVPPPPRRSILLPVVVIAVVFFILLFWYLYRPAPPVKTSFITRSIDREK